MGAGAVSADARRQALQDALDAVRRAHGPIGDEETYCAKALREMIEAHATPHYACGFCGAPGASRRVPLTAPDRATEIYRWFCGPMCEANWGTNQPRPASAAQAELFQ
jgi:hypothetical protein